VTSGDAARILRQLILIIKPAAAAAASAASAASAAVAVVAMEAEAAAVAVVSSFPFFSFAGRSHGRVVHARETQYIPSARRGGGGGGGGGGLVLSLRVAGDDRLGVK